MKRPIARFRGLLGLSILLVSMRICACKTAPSAQVNSPSNSAARSTLLIVLDGLRPDYVTAELMPNLHALGKRGVVFKNHHSVFPTVTRVNAAAIATGCYPAKNGLLGNTVYFPAISPGKGISTGNAKNLQQIEAATGGKLLTAPSLGEILELNGKRLLVVSAGSSGSAFLLNHKVSGGAVVHPELILPESIAPRIKELLGAAPEEAMPNRAMNQWAVDAYLQYGLNEFHANVTIMWLSDPDHTAHAMGVGAPKSNEAIGAVDGEIGRILRALEEKKLRDDINIFVTSDHGFSTHTGSPGLAPLLIENKLKESAASEDVVIVEGAIYVKDHDRERIRAIVQLLQKTDWVGAIFTKRSIPTHPEGFVPGTMAIDSAHWKHERSGDILVSSNWSDAANQYGYKGTTTQGGVAGHGTSSPYDIHNTLVAAGPDIKSEIMSEVPTANIDLAPTICHLSGITPVEKMDGRVIREALRGGPDPKSVTILERMYHSPAKVGDGSYEIELSESGVDGVDYFNYTKVKRLK